MKDDKLKAIDDRDIKLCRNIQKTMEEYGLPQFSDIYPAMDVLQRIKDAGYTRPAQTDVVLSDIEDFIEHNKRLIVLGVLAGVSKSEWNSFKKALANELLKFCRQALSSHLSRRVDESLVFNVLWKIMQRKELSNFSDSFCMICGEPMSEEKRKELVSGIAKALAAAINKGKV